LPDVSVCMSIYNQEPIIEMIINSLYDNMSSNVKEVILLFDGCIDTSEEIVDYTIRNRKIKPIKLYANNVNEVLANNMTFRAATCEYVVTIQDDMQILEKDFDVRMIKPFEVKNNLLGVSGRDAVDVKIVNGDLDYYNTVGRDAVPQTPRDVFGIRQVINRGPIMFRHDRLKEMNYFDEIFAPCHVDDIDISFRAYRKGYEVGSYVINYRSDYYWGASRRDANSIATFAKFAPRSRKIVAERHADLIKAGKTPVDIIIK
jgi:glycosyltransferase involved in cell wall biosynthesis